MFGAIGGVLLYRTRRTRQRRGRRGQSARIASGCSITAEAISLLSAIWVTFQGLSAVRLFIMWQRGCCGMGDIYFQGLVVAIVLSVIVGIRAAVYLQPSEARACSRPDEPLAFPGHVFQPPDPALFVPASQRRGLDREFRPAPEHCVSWRFS